MKLTLANGSACEYACKKFHYSKRTPVIGVSFNVYNDKGEWCGVIMYGFGANSNINKEWGLWGGEVLELTRVALNGKQEFTSKALSLSLKLLKKYCYCVKLVMSYADMDQGHYGTIYQATNWKYLGDRGVNKLKGYRWNGEDLHSRTVENRPDKEVIKKYGVKLYSLGKRAFCYFFDKEIENRNINKFKKYSKSID